MNRLRQTRLRADKSQLQLMQETGIRFSTISLIERGWLKPSEEQKKKLAKALGENADWLFPEDSDDAKLENAKEVLHERKREF